MDRRVRPYGAESVRSHSVASRVAIPTPRPETAGNLPAAASIVSNVNQPDPDRTFASIPVPTRTSSVHMDHTFAPPPIEQASSVPETGQDRPTGDRGPRSEDMPPPTGPKNKAGKDTPVKSSTKRGHEDASAGRKSPTQPQDKRPHVTAASQQSTQRPPDDAGSEPGSMHTVDLTVSQPRSNVSRSVSQVGSVTSSSQVPTGDVDPNRYPAQAEFEAWLPAEPDMIPNHETSPTRFNEFYREFMRLVSFF